MRLSLLTLSVAACFVASVSQVAYAADEDPCTAIKSNCVKSPFNELQIPCSKGGDYTVLEKNDCCCNNESAPSDKGNPPPTTPAPKPNPNKGNPPRRKGKGRLIWVPPRCVRGRRTRQQIIQCARNFRRGRGNRRPGPRQRRQ